MDVILKSCLLGPENRKNLRWRAAVVFIFKLLKSKRFKRFFLKGSRCNRKN